ncbi:hypothetical protein [Dinoroseobacter shibae]|uniref:hypothetical protein n=1 Tax=Dinoroseobacter shibae TaxID=215813 RepID=UPI001FE07D58|nr:hypothetical protein [Dinoroseobacter shibae]URF45102.1 hypothetical protein M8008_09880 [Dinoroseobacter shibae]URF49407.1 hypothetical protein M8007_09880 [Dinoroseobacter shibae]
MENTITNSTSSGVPVAPTNPLGIWPLAGFHCASLHCPKKRQGEYASARSDLKGELGKGGNAISFNQSGSKPTPHFPTIPPKVNANAPKPGDTKNRA